ncbi:hypothetical protein OSB04_022245 [Centaurea solstitialis]|uniref:ALA-interacting subunit n=1 Tax=Centaurea solstitialis TaxID=347529 RepID=A0AA38TE47_9ASTR|nr:hypothetical protein OSB04_022245 [Centaurea solstitialis]
MMDETTPKPKSKSKKPKYSRFTQQELPAWKPILTPGWVIASFVAVAILFIPAGLLCLSASERVVEIVDRYDDECIPDSYSNKSESFIQNKDTNKTCVRTMKVPRKMNAPIFIYYQLDNFYQNHRRYVIIKVCIAFNCCVPFVKLLFIKDFRGLFGTISLSLKTEVRYVKSRSDKQLREPGFAAETSDCKPEDNLGGDKNKPIVPCGLVAWSLFNDTYKLSKGNKVLDINKKDIAWKSDTKMKYGSDVYPKNFQKGELIGGGELDETKPLSEQEDLIVWMKTAALPNFRKLYGKINLDLEANETITIVIQNNYNTYEFGGEKRIVLSTMSWLGGKNDFFGVAFLTVGGICLFMAINFILLYVCKPRPLGDPSYLSWNRNPSGQ